MKETPVSHKEHINKYRKQNPHCICIDELNETIKENSLRLIENTEAIKNNTSNKSVILCGVISGIIGCIFGGIILHYIFIL